MSENVCDLMEQAEVHTERRTAGVYPIATVLTWEGESAPDFEPAECSVVVRLTVSRGGHLGRADADNVDISDYAHM